MADLGLDRVHGRKLSKLLQAIASEKYLPAGQTLSFASSDSMLRYVAEATGKGFVLEFTEDATTGASFLTLAAACDGSQLQPAFHCSSLNALDRVVDGLPWYRRLAWSFYPIILVLGMGMFQGYCSCTLRVVSVRCKVPEHGSPMNVPALATREHLPDYRRQRQLQHRPRD